MTNLGYERELGLREQTQYRMACAWAKLAQRNQPPLRRIFHRTKLR